MTTHLTLTRPPLLSTAGDILSPTPQCWGLNPHPLWRGVRGESSPPQPLSPRSRHSSLLSSRQPGSSGSELSPNTRPGGLGHTSLARAVLAGFYLLAVSYRRDLQVSKTLLQPEGYAEASSSDTLRRVEPLLLQLFLISPFGLWGEMTQILFSLCVYVCVHACVSVCTCACMCVQLHMCVYLYVCLPARIRCGVCVCI